MLNEYKQESLRELITRSRSFSNLSTVINKSLNDIKKELTNPDKNIKVHALLKLLFFYLNNNDIKWANLSSMEIITTCGLKGKRVGYLIAQLQFKNNPEWILMLPNLIRKDLQSQNNSVIGMSLDLINNIINPTLVNEITKDLEKLLNLNNTSIRKKLVISLTKSADILLKNNINPEFWDDLLIKLITILNNKNKEKELTTGLSICIISCIQKICKNFPDKTITVFMELMNYFTKCEINWNVIKIIDIFGDFLKLESRLSKKKEFIKLISDKLSITKSKSVEIQLVKLVITYYDNNSSNESGGNPENNRFAQVTAGNNQSNNLAGELFNNCEERLKNLLLFNDNNLVLIALRILRELFKKNKVISNNYLNDVMKILENTTCKPIQSECLDIIYLCVSKENYKTIVNKLLSVIENLGNKAVQTILNICSFDSYSRLEKKEDFEWFLEILFETGKNEFLKNELGSFTDFVGNEDEMKIAYILRDISQRTDMLREYISAKSLDLTNFLFTKIKNFTGKNKKNSSINSKISSKNIQKVFIESSTNFFEENSNLKHPNSLLTVLLFILGEYSFSGSILESENRNNFYKKFYSFTIELIDIMLLSKDIKESYFYSFLIFLTKVLTNTKGNVNLINLIFVNQEKRNFEEFQNLIKEKLNKLILHEDLFDLEVYGALDLVRKLICLIDMENPLFFEEYNKKKKLLPLHDKAQSMVLLSKEFDINICFPIDDEELNVSKVGVQVKENIDVKGNSNQNLNNNLGGNNCENSMGVKPINEEGNIIVIDRNLYTPSNI